MHDDTIQRILNRMNRGAREVITTQVASDVWWGFAWGASPKGYSLGGVQTEGDEMFFIKAPDGRFGAAVLRMGSHEMHWYVAPRYRRKRLLVEPLKKTILPFIFAQHDTDGQGGSVDLARPFAEASTKVALRAGMHEVERKGKQVFYRIDRREAGKFERFAFPTGTLEELEQLKNQALIRYRALRMMFDQVRVRYLAHMRPQKVDYIISQLESKRTDLIDMVEDAHWSLKADNK
jgi:hypothetical protein